MYRRPKFLEVLLRVREEMAREADYDADRFAEMVRSGARNQDASLYSLPDEPEETARRPRTSKTRS